MQAASPQDVHLGSEGHVVLQVRLRQRICHATNEEKKVEEQINPAALA